MNMYALRRLFSITLLLLIIFPLTPQFLRAESKLFDRIGRRVLLTDADVDDFVDPVAHGDEDFDHLGAVLEEFADTLAQRLLVDGRGRRGVRAARGGLSAGQGDRASAQVQAEGGDAGLAQSVLLAGRSRVRPESAPRGGGDFYSLR